MTPTPSPDTQDDGSVMPPSGTAATATKGALLGAMFLMATSAIGPGFITQTTVFTAQLGAAFAFAIVISIIVDIAVQLNVWRVIGVSGLRAQDLANKVIPGFGYVLAGLVAFGGLVFNIGNIGGTGLGANAMLGVDAKIGGAVSALVAIGIFVSKRAGVAMDRIVVVLGVLMIAMVAYAAVATEPPYGEALTQAVLPDKVEFLIITTLIGGTVGGYITYAGAHRIVDSGITGPERVAEISRGSITGILVTGVMRALLFLAILGVVVGGVNLVGVDNPPAVAFESALGKVGLHIFGVILWAASITSVIGASYTSVSFLTTFSETIKRHAQWVVIGFIVFSAAIYLSLGQTPATLLVLAGALNGLILPFGFGIVIWVLMRRDLLGGYRYPKVLAYVGLVVWLLTIYLGYESFSGIVDLWQQ
ncbi:NRAMP family divalent metal transporter [Janibacter indicus]|uniref:NRAMP family divalent metal transporter n=1 Tax=Janibacter indicus TaxID=857417 RepID=UPI003D9A2725